MKLTKSYQNVTLESTITKDQLKKIQTHCPDALVLKDENKKAIFAVETGMPGCITNAAFASTTSLLMATCSSRSVTRTCPPNLTRLRPTSLTPSASSLPSSAALKLRPQLHSLLWPLKSALSLTASPWTKVQLKLNNKFKHKGEIYNA